MRIDEYGIACYVGKEKLDIDSVVKKLIMISESFVIQEWAGYRCPCAVHKHGIFMGNILIDRYRNIEFSAIHHISGRQVLAFINEIKSRFYTAIV